MRSLRSLRFPPAPFATYKVALNPKFHSLRAQLPQPTAISPYLTTDGCIHPARAFYTLGPHHGWNLRTAHEQVCINASRKRTALQTAPDS